MKRVAHRDRLVPPGGVGYCGVISNKSGRLLPRASDGGLRAIVHWYLDPHPTNCVATPVCPAATSAGYPVYTDTPGVERGRFNLAVFFAGCSLDCLFCQNWEHKTMLRDPNAPKRTIDELVEAAMDPRVTCICFFGGDPTPHSQWALAAARRIASLAKREGVVKRICWETDGLASPGIMRTMASLSLKSGGIVKVDWKAWTPSIYEALTGGDGWKALRRLRENTAIISRMARERPEPPLLVVSILLVPGYVGPSEVYAIASYLATLDPSPPVVLLGFHGELNMRDLPTTSWDHAERAVRAVRRAGIKEVYIGNEWLLSNSYKVEDWWDPEAWPKPYQL
jgi:pyruvate formate lyase activating enzyme